MFVFGFECRGIHTTLRPEQITAIVNNIESGLKDIPYGEKITFHLSSFSSDQQRQEELAALTKSYISQY